MKWVLLIFLLPAAAVAERSLIVSGSASAGLHSRSHIFPGGMTMFALRMDYGYSPAKASGIYVVPSVRVLSARGLLGSSTESARWQGLQLGGHFAWIARSTVAYWGGYAGGAISGLDRNTPLLGTEIGGQFWLWDHGFIGLSIEVPLTRAEGCCNDSLAGDMPPAPLPRQWHSGALIAAQLGFTL